jgi:DNA-directed RNA polymerase subunit M/transcription elongation factor TFIIS
MLDNRQAFGLPLRTKRRRTERRTQDRARAKLARDLERLFKLGAGGSPDRPIVISSPSEVEVQARGTPCPICQGELRVDEHRAETVGATRLRVAKVTCAACGAGREIYFQLRASTLN